MDRSIVHDVHMAINLAHRFVYFVPEKDEVYTALGLTGQVGTYFAPRTAPLGPVGPDVVVATFYNFHPRAVAAGDINDVWNIAAPTEIQSARFRVVEQAVKRVGVSFTPEELAEARALVDPVVAGLNHAGKPLAAANAAVALPADPATALWQQITVIREWRGDVHNAVLIANGIGPCECLVLQSGSGRVPAAMLRATRLWNDEEWSAAIQNLTARGWTNSAGELTAEGAAGREALEDDTDRLCEPIWEPIGDAGAKRLGELVSRFIACTP